MKKKLYIILLLTLLLFVGCERKDRIVNKNNLQQNLNLKILNMAGKKGSFKEFNPDTIQPNDFYSGKFDPTKYNVIAYDETTIDRFKKDGKIELLFDKNYAYIVKNSNTNIKDLYNKLKNIETKSENNYDLIMYRVYDDEIKIVSLKNNETNLDSILFILNQLYHTKSRAEFDEWYLNFIK